MTTIEATTTFTGEPATAGHPIRRAALTSGATAAATTTALAAAAGAAGIPLAVDGESIPLLGFAQLTAVGALLGGLLAAGMRRWGGTRGRTTFVAVTAALTLLSCVPSVALPPDAATRFVLVATHVAAAAIIVPALARHLPTAR